MKLLKKIPFPMVSLIINLICAVGYFAIGLQFHSWWFITIGVYDAVLAAARFCILDIARKSKGHPGTELSRITGILLIALSVCLIGVNILSALKDRGSVFREIVMIAIAVYSFTKITMAVVGMVKARGSTSEIVKTLRNISFADSVVSIYSLQRSMLVSFPGMHPSDIQLLNILTGTAVWMIVLFLGLNLTGGKYVLMAKSKIAALHKKLAETVTEGYRKIEEGVVDGYQKMEKGVVKGYTKLEDKFVAAYLTHEDETVEEAKARLRKNIK